MKRIQTLQKTRDRSKAIPYLKYMDKAFLHPGEQDVMARLQKLEDRLVRLNLKGLHATGRILYMVGVAWKMGHNQEPLTTERFEELMEKSKAFSANWLDNRPARDELKAVLTSYKPSDSPLSAVFFLR